MPKRIQDAELSAGSTVISGSRAWYRRVPWTPIVITLAVVFTSGMAVKPVRDAETFLEVSEAFLVKPPGYVAMAPLSGLFDMLTLLSVRQHIALFLAVIILFAAARVMKARGGAGWRSHMATSAALLGAVVLTYVLSVMLPRPMALLASTDPNVMKVDFHSHTSASRDARDGFSVEANRAWHKAGGYDVAYITDHATVEAAERGLANNPRPGSENVMLLQGIEATWTGEHVVILGAQRTYTGVLTENLRDVDEQSLRLASLVASREPVVVWNHPRELNRLPVVSEPGTAGIRAIEISNGSPQGMDKVRPKRAAIVALAVRENVALTGGSDNHGWGRTAPNWTILRLPNWRALAPDALATLIERTLRDGGYRATRVVERVVADPGGSNMAVALTVFTVPFRLLTTLSNEERVMWLVWTWALFGAIWWRRRGVSS